jgi:YD repeat-containing protein
MGDLFEELENGYRIIDRDGTEWLFQKNFDRLGAQYAAELSQITYPSGEIITYSNYGGQFCTGSNSCQFPRTITSSRGFQIVRPNYYSFRIHNLALMACSFDTGCSSAQTGMPQVTSTQSALNGAQTRISTDALNRSWSITRGPFVGEFRAGEITSPAGRSLKFSARRLTPVEHPYCFGGAGLGYARCSLSTNPIYFVEKAGKTWAYTYASAKQTEGLLAVATTSTSPLGASTVVRVGQGTEVVVDPNGRSTTKQFGGHCFENSWGCADEFLEAARAPAGNEEVRSYFRGSLDRIQTVPRPGASEQPLVVTAAYPAACTNRKTCAKPTSTVDARGSTTFYTYHGPSGMVASITTPADASGRRAILTYTYVQQFARYRQTDGSMQNFPSPIWVLQSEARCMTAEVCIGTADEVKTVYEYDDNLQPVVERVLLGTGLVLRETRKTYDAAGNVSAVDGAQPGPDDTHYYFYDSMRQKVGWIGPDPDGAAHLPRPAERYTYDLDGLLTLVETGRASGSSLSSLQSMVVDKTSATFYNADGRKVRNELRAGGLVQSVTQMTYDADGRLQCSALRMDPACAATTTVAG